MRRRTVYAILAFVCAVLGVAALTVGVILATTFGRSEQIRSEPTALIGPGAVVIAEQLQVDASNIPLPDGVGELTVEVAPIGPRALFVGTAQPAPLDDYLAAVPYDVVTSLEPGGQAQLRSVPGSILPRPPAQETFWIEQSAGAAGQTVRLDADLGEQASLVVTNAVPGNGVAADIRVTYTLRGVWNTALGLMIGGVLALLLTVVLAWRSRAAGRRARAAAATASPAPAAPAPPAAPLAATVLPTGPPTGSPTGPPTGAPSIAEPPTAVLPAVPADPTGEQVDAAADRDG